MMGFSLEVTLFLICFSLPYSQPLLDLTCVSLGYNLVARLTLGLYVRDSNNQLVIVTTPNGINTYCNEQFRVTAQSATIESSWSIGGHKYGSIKNGNAALSIFKPTLGITVDDR